MDVCGRGSRYEMNWYSARLDDVCEISWALLKIITLPKGYIRIKRARRLVGAFLARGNIKITQQLKTPHEPKLKARGANK